MVSFYTRKCCLFVGLCFFLPVHSLFAQQYFSLQNLIDSASGNLPLLKQKQALVKSSRASLTEVRHTFLPKVSFSEQVNVASNNSIAGTYFTFGITPSTSAGVRDDNTLHPATGNIAVLYSQYELENFGLNTAKINYALSNVDFQQADLQREQYSLQLEIAKRYFNILKNQYKLSADKQNIDRYKNIYKVIKALTNSGVIAGADSSQASAELARANINYNQTLGAINQLKEELAYFTGIPATQMLMDTSYNNFIRSKPVSPNLETNTGHNPLIDYYEKRKNIFLYNDALIRKSYLPKIILASSLWARGSSIQYNDDFKSLPTGLGYQRVNYAVGIALTYNLFNSLYKKDELAINRYQQQASDYELQQQVAAVNSSVLRAENILRTTEANLVQIPIQLQSAQVTYNQKVAQYKAGLISLIDVTNAAFVLYRSQTDLIEASTDWHLAQLDRAAFTGNLTRYIQTIK